MNESGLQIEINDFAHRTEMFRHSQSKQESLFAEKAGDSI